MTDLLLLEVAVTLDVGERLAEAGGLVQYALVVLFAAIPVVEILVVIPIAIGLGLDPVVTGVAAFGGNVGSVYALVWSQGRLATWWREWRDSGEQTDDLESGRSARARRIWDRYGLPGLSIAAPILTGVHLAALVALAAGSRRRAVLWWMTIGIAGWTVVLVVASIFGSSLLGIV